MKKQEHTIKQANASMVKRSQVAHLAAVAKYVNISTCAVHAFLATAWIYVSTNASDVHVPNVTENRCVSIKFAEFIVGDVLTLKK